MDSTFQANEINLILFAGIAIMLGLALALVLIFNQSQRKVLEQKELELEKEKELNDRLKQIDKLKDQFLANTSHELRTPLQGIIGISEHLLKVAGTIEPLELRDNLRLSIASGKRLNSLVDDLLDFSKLKNNDVSLNISPVNFNALTEIVLRNNAPLANSKQLKLINEVPKEQSTLMVDENRIQQVLYNLVGNAIKFTEKGTIVVGQFKTEQAEKDLLTFYVQDTGIGIPKAKQESIFLEFEQGDGSISRAYTGSGLGLSISKRLVELHGGSLWLESTEGQGAIFYFSLPLSKLEVLPRLDVLEEQLSSVLTHLDVQEEVRQTAIPGPKGNSAEVSILVVDDEPINQKVLQNHLSDNNYELTQVLNGEEALRLIREGKTFDLVILDVMMPRISGYEVCERIRQQYLPSELPIIMVTAKNQVQDLVQGLSQGANDYLAKPFSREEFLARVKTQLELHRINAVTGKFVPTEFLHSLGRERITEVMLGDQTEREVSVLFTDIRDYTALSEGMSPEDNFKFVMDFHGRMGPVIYQNHGFINQYLGDAIMAIFPNKPEDALQAAIEMHQALILYNEDRKALDFPPLRIGTGFHTGPLIMGIIGDHKRMDAATISDTVNTASRIESLTKYYSAPILFTEDSLGQMGEIETAYIRYLGKVVVKGKKNPIGIYEHLRGYEEGPQKLKLKTKSIFDKARDDYFNKDFSKAIIGFEEVLIKDPEDLLSQLFLQKAAKLKKEAISDDWTGVEVLSFK